MTERTRGRIRAWRLAVTIPLGLLLGADLSVRAEEAFPTPSPLVPEGPVDPAAYIVGPGDAFTVAVLGQVQDTRTIPVSPEGTVIVPPAGVIPVASLSLAEAKREILSALAEYYRDADIQITLTGLRRFEIHVLGQVESPGTYIGTALTRISSAVDLAGGFLDEGSRRRVLVRGADGSTRLADVMRFEMLGERDRNPFVADGDLVYVPVQLQDAAVYGHVALPGRYEIVEGETIADFLRIAGDFTESAVVESVEVYRFLDDDPSRTHRFLADFRDPVAAAADPQLRIRSGDEIFVRGVSQWHLHRGATVTGEVHHPGVYVIDEGTERVSDLIRRAGGVTIDADLHGATLTRRSFRSEKPDREFERLRTVPVTDMTRDERAYFKMRSRENREDVVIDFVALFDSGSVEDDVLLRRGDGLHFPRASHTVTVSGQVVNPGPLPHQAGAGYGHYVARAGGFAHRASKGKIRIIKGATGIWFDRGDTPIEPDDTIWVPEKPDRDYWGLFKDFMTVVVQVATVYIVVDRAAN